MTEKPSTTDPRRIFPWWGSVCLAVVSYVSLTYGVPLIAHEHPELQQLSQFAPSLAPIITIGFLLLAGQQLYAGSENTKKEQKNVKPDSEVNTVTDSVNHNEKE
jgi:hypothetical protein